MKKLKKGIVATALAATLALPMLPTSAKAAEEYLVLGVGTYNSSQLSNLNNGDATKFRDRLSGLGWTKNAEFYNAAVYYTDFYKYGNAADIVYFTGHGGSNGNLSLTNHLVDNSALNSYANPFRLGGNLYGYDDTASKDLEWLILAACDVMDDVDWGRQLANGVHAIYSYHNVSNDYTDTSIIDNFINRAWGKGGYTATTMYSAWINANRYYGEHDWAIIGHNGNKADYMHGIGNKATADINGLTDIYRWKGYQTYDGTAGGITTENISGYLKSANQLTQTTSQQELNTINETFNYTFKVKPEKLKLNDLKVNLLGKEYKKFENSKSDVFSSKLGTLEINKDNSFVYSRDIHTTALNVTEEAALKNIESFIANNGGMRDDLVLKSVTPISELDNEGKEIITGYTVIYAQTLNNTYLDVDTSSSILVGYDVEGVNFYQRNVKEVTQKVKQNKSLKKMENVMEKAKGSARSTFKGIEEDNISFESAEFVYFTSPMTLGLEKDDLVPAYKINLDETNAIYLNALTGEQLHGGKMLAGDEEVIIPTMEEMLEVKEATNE